MLLGLHAELNGENFLLYRLQPVPAGSGFGTRGLVDGENLLLCHLKPITADSGPRVQDLGCWGWLRERTQGEHLNRQNLLQGFGLYLIESPIC